MLCLKQISAKVGYFLMFAALNNMAVSGKVSPEVVFKDDAKIHPYPLYPFKIVYKKEVCKEII